MIDEDDNTAELHSVLTTELSKYQVAECFKRSGWSMRASAWNEYEIEMDTSELEIVGEGEILMSGLVNDYRTTVPLILNILRNHSIGYQLECYDQQKNLLKEYRIDQQEPSSGLADPKT